MDRDKMREIAKRLAKNNLEGEPDIKKVLWFPHEDEVRLVEVLPDVIPSDQVVAFHFGPDHAGGIPVPSAIALILPDEEGKIPVPQGWVDWKDTEEIDVLRVRKAV